MEIKPRVCHLKRTESGYGFHLYGAKHSSGHIIKKVEESGVAALAGMKAGDKIIAVNGDNVEELTHMDVVAKIKENKNETKLLLIDEDGDKYCKEHNILITEDLLKDHSVDDVSTSLNLHQFTPISQTSSKVTDDVTDSEKLRPKLCKLVKGEGGYGFNLHSEKGSSSKSVSFVEAGGVADRAGVKVHDRLIQVNGLNVESENHSRVVRRIVESGDSVELLFVDKEADAYYAACDVTPTVDHVTGDVPDKKAKSVPPPPPEVGESSDVMTQFSEEMFAMNLDSLKAKVQSKRKQAPSAGWGDRKAIFNNF